MGGSESKDLRPGDGTDGEDEGNSSGSGKVKDHTVAKMAIVGAAVATAALVTWGAYRLLSDPGTEDKMKPSERNDCEPSNPISEANFTNGKITKNNNLEKPESDTIKLNTDAARYDEERNCGRIGGLLRNSSGSVISFYSIKTELSNVDVLELQAIKEGILQAARENVQRLWVESDCKSVVDVINGSCKCSKKNREPVEEIRLLLEKFPWKKVTSCKREANRAANHLTKFNCPYQGRDIPPTSILRELAKLIEEDLK
ncbi:uncharacterized protein LOC143851380 isoform X2 [Tasmannia lanceolata]|uniref:uncharacterized protein LOC143851380 isoform X2 n=1 Tax=Tasmannia lanceolata TaxID=3420 RepID=UPI00406303FB